MTARSIPACAGEPSVKPANCMVMTVYPRVCGGTSTAWTTRIAPAGLSPRVRGNLSAWRSDQYSARSIPACAGEPAYIRPHCTS